MGIRIHKQLGYGLVDVKTEKYQIIDERFNSKGLMRVDYEDREKWNIAGYKAWLQARKDKICEENKCVELKDEIGCAFEYVMELMTLDDVKHDLEYCFTYNAEYGLPTVFNITPIHSISQWQRYDDFIDTIEASIYDDIHPECNYYKLMSYNLFPNCNYWDTRTGIEIKNAYLYERLLGYKTTTPNVPEYQEHLAQLIGFEDAESCFKYLRPAVPKNISLLCEYCEIFNDLNTIRELQPMLYVYWS